MSTHFSTLRYILANEATKGTFFNLVEFLSGHRSSKEFDMMLEYTNTHLESWPDSERELKIQGPHWVYWPDNPVLSLAKVLNLDNCSFGDEGLLSFLESPYFPELYAFHCWHNEMSDESVATLVEHPKINGIRELSLEHNKITAQGAKLIAEARNLHALTLLELGDNLLGDEGCNHLSQGKFFQNLTLLGLEKNDISDYGLQFLSKSEGFPKVNEFMLWDNRIECEGLVALANSPAFSSLEIVSLSGNYIRDKGLLSLAYSPYLTNLKQVSLGKDPEEWEVLAEGSDTLDTLFESKNFANIETIELTGFTNLKATTVVRACQSKSLNQIRLRGCNLNSEDIEEIFHHPHLADSIEALCLCNNDIRDEGVQAIASSPHLQNLKSICMNSIGATSEGMRALASSQNCQQLKSLIFLENTVGDEGAEALASSTMLENLRELYLHYNAIGNKGATAIVQSPHLQELEILYLWDAHIGNDAYIALAESKLTNLKKLCFGYDLPSFEVVEQLAKAESLSQLEELQIRSALFLKGAQKKEALRLLTSSKTLSPKVKRLYLKQLPLTELRKLAAGYKIPGRSKMSKTQLCNMIIASEIIEREQAEKTDSNTDE